MRGFGIESMSENGNRLSVRYIEIDEISAGQRVDNFLLRILKGVPKSRIYRCLRKGEVRINGGRSKASRRLMAGDRVRIPPLRTSQGSPAKATTGLVNILHNSIIYEDDRILIINKPAGLAVHGGSGVAVGVIEAIRQHRPEEKSLELVHRLDRNTSGCLMIAKKRKYLKSLQQLLANKVELEKHYQAIVHGRWPKRKQHVDVPLRKNTLSSGERICIVASDGKPCMTKIRVSKQNDEFSLLEIRPITGRTHQIRVHCQHAGYPIVGDDKYGAEKLDKQLRKRGFQRLMLHASKLVIPAIDVGDDPIIVEAETDDEFAAMTKEYL